MDWEQKKQEIRDKVDDELVERLELGGIVGIEARKYSREEARQKLPELSSDNPSRIWTRTQQEAIGTNGSMEDAVLWYDNLLLPAALDALRDQQGQILTSGKTCQWPPSPYAQAWVSWCVNNVFYIKKNIEEQVYNLGKGEFNLWEIGEISTGIFAKRVAVETTYKGGLEVKHYYPEKNWY